MNIRKREIVTHVIGDFKDVAIDTIFGTKTKNVWVDGSHTTKEILEYLNPETAKWEKIPTTREYVTVSV